MSASRDSSASCWCSDTLLCCTTVAWDVLLRSSNVSPKQSFEHHPVGQIGTGRSLRGRLMSHMRTKLPFDAWQGKLSPLRSAERTKRL